ncbi:MAG: 50S ribosomal protein L24 [Myxococcales bacterium]
MARIKKNDTVLVIAGKNKGKRGKVLRVVEGGTRVLVEKVNVVKRHQKPTQKHPQGGIIDKEAPINASNVMLVSPTTDQPLKVKRKFIEAEDGSKRKVRYDAKSGETIE